MIMMNYHQKYVCVKLASLFHAEFSISLRKYEYEIHTLLFYCCYNVHRMKIIFMLTTTDTKMTIHFTTYILILSIHSVKFRNVK